MEIGDKVKIDFLETITWTICKEFKVKNGNKYFLIKPDKEKYNNMIINEDNSIVVMDVFKNMKEERILQVLQKEIFEEDNPCGDCINYGDKNCMKNMRKCEYSKKDYFLEEVKGDNQ